MTLSSPAGSLPAADAVSRRTILLQVGAGGLAFALFADRHAETVAQDATPAASPSAGLPAGVGLTPLVGIPIRDLPKEPFTLNLTQLTMAPGTSLPNSSTPFVEIAYVESGNLTCPGEDGRWVYAADGTMTASGAGDLAVPKGSAIYVAPNALDGARNDGTDPLSALIIDLVPTSSMGTPAAMATPGA